MTSPSSSKASAARAAITSSNSAASPEASELTLAQTPAERLGSAPAGFGPELGARAPDATLPDVHGKMQSLHALYARGPTLLIFYRGGWCPFCNLQLRELARAKPEFDRRGVQIVAISVDRPSEEAKTQARHGVAFPMLSDSRLVAHQSYRVIHVPGEAEREILAGYEVDLASHSGEAHGSFAVPASILVDRSGVVCFVHVDEDFKTRPSAEQLLAVAERTLG